MKYSNKTNLLVHLVFSLLLILTWAYPANAQGPVVRAVIFHSPTCGHCEKVLKQDLPAFFQLFPDQIEIVSIDVSKETGQKLYQAAIEKFDLQGDRLGVPTLVVGDTVLVGSQEIPDRFPGLVEQGLAEGGLDFPAISGLKDAVGTPVERTTASQQNGGSVWDTFNRDPVANSIAVVVLIGMVFSFILLSYRFIQGASGSLGNWPRWFIPLLAVLGLGVALYLTFVEVTQSEAFCGPVGDCNSVQQSRYGKVFGVVPVGIFGAAGYIALLIAWLIQSFGPQGLRGTAALAVFGMAWFGVLFSIYLTFTEPFIIGATCMWCISSAIIMTLILWAATPDAKMAWDPAPDLA